MKRLSGFVCGALSMLLCVCLLGTALAVVEQRTAQLNFNNIKVTLDGVNVDLVDAAGNAVEPFIIDGTTYLPVRAVAGALGLDVGWDNDTKTVLLKSQSAELQETRVIIISGPVSGVRHELTPETTVYVSNASNTIHSVHTCSGMKNYREMTAAEADANGYKYCEHCW